MQSGCLVLGVVICGEVVGLAMLVRSGLEILRTSSARKLLICHELVSYGSPLCGSFRLCFKLTFCCDLPPVLLSLV